MQPTNISHKGSKGVLELRLVYKGEPATPWPEIVTQPYGNESPPRPITKFPRDLLEKINVSGWKHLRPKALIQQK